MNSRDIIKALAAVGWESMRATGRQHHDLHHPAAPKLATVRLGAAVMMLAG